jgi:hypothetical protein
MIFPPHKRGVSYEYRHDPTMYSIRPSLVVVLFFVSFVPIIMPVGMDTSRGSSIGSGPTADRQGAVELAVLASKNDDNPVKRPSANGLGENKTVVAVTLTYTQLLALVLLVAAAFLAIGIAIGREMCSATESGKTTPQPTPAPTIVDDCSVAFAFGDLSNLLYANTTYLEDACLLHDVAPFLDFMLASLRLEVVLGNLLALFLMSLAAQLGGIPNVKNGDGEYSALGSILWLTWIGFAIVQYATTCVAQLTLVLATFSFAGQGRGELVTLEGGIGEGLGAAVGAGVGGFLGIFFVLLIATIQDGDFDMSVFVLFRLFLAFISPVCLAAALGAFYGSFTGAPLFTAVIPSLLVHPSFVAKNAALAVYAFTISQGVKDAGFNLDPDKLMRKYALVMVAPVLGISAFYLIFTASFVFSFFFYAPMSLCLFVLFAVAWRALQLVQMGSEWSGKVESLTTVVCCNPLAPFSGSLWWLPNEALLETLKHLEAATTMLLVVLFSSLLLVLSPALVFGPWTAFYSYLGHTPSENMAYVALIYRHFFGVFIDFDFYMPDLFDFHWAELSEWASVLVDVPSFNELPPAAMLDGSTVFSTLSLLLALTKPLVCVLSLVFSLAGVLGKNKTLGNVAAATSSIKAILENLKGDECIAALKLKGLACATNEDGQVTMLSKLPGVNNDSFDMKALASCPALVKVDFTGCKNVTGACSR